jgi:hypothetical protein
VDDTILPLSGQSNAEPVSLPSALTRSRLAWALVGLPLALQALIVHLFGVNTLVWDELYYVDFIRQVRAGESWLPWLWRQHNEHRVIPMKLAMAPLALLTRWDTRAEMYLSVVLAGLVLLGLWRLYRLAGGDGALLFAPTAWLVCSLAQFQNMLYGMMICHYFTLLGVVWALVFLARGSAGGLAAAVLCGATASYSIANGLLVWPVGLALLLVQGVRRSLTAAWAAASVVMTALYFYRFQMPAGTPPFSYDLAGLYRFASFAAACLGAPLGAGSMDWSRAAGLAVAVAVLAVAWRWRHPGRPALQEESLPGALILFALLSCAMIAYGRASSGVPPLESRYIAYSSLALIGVWLVFTGRREAPAGRLWLVGAAALLIPGLLAANLFGLREAKRWHSLRLREEFLFQTAAQQPDEALAGLYFVPELRRMVPYLRAERLGPFDEPRRLLLLVRWREGQVAGEILPGRPIEQTFVCGVDTLRDAEGVLATYGRKSRSTVVVSLWEGGRRLADRTVPLAGLADSAWIPLELAEPLHRCAGRRLTMRFESSDATPGNAASVWTYPGYYEGELRQSGAAVLPGRALGLQLNARAAGLLD